MIDLSLNVLILYFFISNVVFIKNLSIFMTYFFG